ncbi:MAG: FkbM family methyltransferase [Flavobacteriales bacterium]
MGLKRLIPRPIRELKYLVRRSRSALGLVQNDGTDRYLNAVGGVLHVGANTGQERHLYHRNGVRVLWVEPIPEVFEQLARNLEEFPRQQALRYLLTDKDGATYDFHIANNGGASSSILDLKEHVDIWPEVGFERSIKLTGRTLDSIVTAHRIDLRNYPALVMDTQGSELLVLKGATIALQNFRYIKTEVSDFEVYSGCCTLHDLSRFLSHHGFREAVRQPFAAHPKGGQCYDVLFERVR